MNIKIIQWGISSDTTPSTSHHHPNQTRRRRPVSHKSAHSGAPTLRKNAATSCLSFLMANLRGVLPHGSNDEGAPHPTAWSASPRLRPKRQVGGVQQGGRASAPSSLQRRASCKCVWEEKAREMSTREGDAPPVERGHARLQSCEWWLSDVIGRLQAGRRALCQGSVLKWRCLLLKAIILELARDYHRTHTRQSAPLHLQQRPRDH